MGLAFLGDELEARRATRICIEDGVVVGISGGRGTSLVAIPAFINSHVHILDYSAAGVNALAEPGELLPWPRGLKARLIQASPGAALRGASEALERALRMGYAGLVVFVEGGGAACRLVKNLAAARNISVLCYGRATRLEELEGCDGLGVPHLETGAWRRVAGEAASRGLRVAAHVSETDWQALLGDYLDAVAHRFDHVVHLLHAPCEAQRAVLEAGVMPVYTPISNALLWRREPRICVERFLLGTDNVGWSPLNPWELARRAVTLLLRNGIGLREAAWRALAALTVWAWRWHYGLPGLAEGSPTPILLLHAPHVVRAIEPLVALLETCDVDCVVGVASSAHFEAKGEAESEGAREG